MKPFESFLAPQLTEYLAYRQGLGYTLMPTRANLLIFDRYLIKTQADWTSFEPAFFLDMTARLNTESRTVNGTVSALRVFFRFLVRRDYLEENPVRDIPPLKENTIVPFTFSPEQVDQFLDVICTKIRKTKGRFPKDFALYLVLLLLARCGMRISEPLRLLQTHYRDDEATLYIEKTKFKKDRLIPIPMAAATELENYLAVRTAFRRKDQDPYLLAGPKQGGLNAQRISRAFHKAVQDIGLERSRELYHKKPTSRLRLPFQLDHPVLLPEE